MVILDALSYDICVTTPDHFFSYLSNLTVDDHAILTQMIDQARSALSHDTLGNEHTCFLFGRMMLVLYLELLSNYSSSVVTLSVLLVVSPVSSYGLISEMIKSFVVHKKDQSEYLVSGYAFAFPLLIFSLSLSFLDTTQTLYSSTSKCSFVRIMTSSTAGTDTRVQQ